jgi:hypothetical protein
MVSRKVNARPFGQHDKSCEQTFDAAESRVHLPVWRIGRTLEVARKVLDPLHIIMLVFRYIMIRTRGGIALLLPHERLVHWPASVLRSSSAEMTEEPYVRRVHWSRNLVPFPFAASTSIGPWSRRHRPPQTTLRSRSAVPIAAIGGWETGDFRLAEICR